jgi:peptidoglycan-associated lipoprotein
MKKLPLFVLAGATLLLAGCPKTPTTPPDAGASSGSAVPAQPEAEANTAATDSAATTAQDTSTMTPAQPLPDPEAALVARTVIYFALDSEAVAEEFAAMVTAHGKRLGAGSARVRLEGHTDERGSDSYNNALGLRRAEAVKKALKLAGAQEAQAEAVSFGEQKPAAGGEGEGDEAWAKNRRVEIVYLP